ncbi:hypothetical protein BpHYR1_042575 [Brachionus plicatilis]|uniref:Uncharacterized protein n=1 Tax=Brachionus plicatilis TaxID=10195 RepID=A0A3M7SAV9_BRAPC|nr:hypothetical protein BpHYR1_042575 [Brachionus plicatilis]
MIQNIPNQLFSQIHAAQKKPYCQKTYRIMCYMEILIKQNLAIDGHGYECSKTAVLTSFTIELVDRYSIVSPGRNLVAISLIESTSSLVGQRIAELTKESGSGL